MKGSGYSYGKVKVAVLKQLGLICLTMLSSSQEDLGTRVTWPSMCQTQGIVSIKLSKEYPFYSIGPFAFHSLSACDFSSVFSTIQIFFHVTWRSPFYDSDPILLFIPFLLPFCYFSSLTWYQNQFNMVLEQNSVGGLSGLSSWFLFLLTIVVRTLDTVNQINI